MSAEWHIRSLASFVEKTCADTNDSRCPNPLPLAPPLPLASLRTIMAPAATTSNGEVRNLQGISDYTKFWQKDAKNDSQTDRDNRLSEYTSVVNGECKRET